MTHCIKGNVTWDDEYSCSPNAQCEEQDNVHQCYCKAGYHGDGQTCEFLDCNGVYDSGHNTSGIYTIKPTNWPGSPFTVYCNMNDGEGWTVFQRRVNGSVDFYRNWTSYKEGFGKLDHEFWLGNDKLFYLTNQSEYQLRIDLVDSEGAPYYGEYDLFRINDENDNYRLSGLGKFTGTTSGEFNIRRCKTVDLINVNTACVGHTFDLDISHYYQFSELGTFNGTSKKIKNDFTSLPAGECL
ncbi:putative fibrinogen-like protein 1-like [Apostichopus japonicus]|uniref:Putative fibrinogen-like protein 1-like n=1 Tax=Stichopus japonicus TaxID=307972 RepID=A0A2G8KPF8_STIJA|nr:putative fibrinogen-like protein 1-like [Apostichopus japonicus]